MEIHVAIHTYNTYGGNPSISLVGPYFHMGAPDFGEGISEIEVHVYFKSGRGPKKTLESLYKQYHDYLTTLPNSKFFRKKGKIEVNFLSNLGDAGLVSGFGPPKHDLFVRSAKEIADELAAVRRKLKKTDVFDIDGFLEYLGDKVARLPATNEEFLELQRAMELHEKKRHDAMDEWEKLAIDWEDYHPDAREILDDPFYWDCDDDFAPNGNDTGADILGLYEDWRKKNRNRPALQFFDKLMGDWEVQVPPTQDDEFSITTFEESIVGMAFAQLKVDGVCDEAIRARALDGLRSHRKRIEADHKDWELFEERMTAFSKVEAKLNEVTE